MSTTPDMSKEREAFEAWCAAQGRNLERAVWDSNQYVSAYVQNDWEVWQARASLAASAGSEPVGEVVTRYYGGNRRSIGFQEAQLYRGVQLDGGTKLYTHPSPPEGAAAEQALLKVLDVTRRYLPPDGPSAHEAMSEIIAIVDPWPLGPLEN